MTLDELKLRLQQHLSDGLVTIVGLGLSASHGLPTMGALSEHLRTEIPIHLAGASNSDWDQVESQLAAGEGLEAALDAIPHGSMLIPIIVEESAALMIAAETKAIQDALRAGKPMPFEALVPHLLHATDSAEVITTNYDRLIEIAVEMAGYRVECAFPSAYYSRLDESAAKKQVREWVPVGRSATRRTHKHVRLSKPHGSLDWYLLANEPVRSVLNLLEPRLMVSPGSSKYLRGYDIPFDLHRERSNKAIDSAARFLIIGYGFNDHHLETHLRARLAAGIPAVVLTRELTPNARECILAHSTMIALEESIDPPGTHVLTSSSDEVFEGISIWALSNFVEEVLT
ncbi:MAG: SIR2 family protein [Acidimicrobiales bacterium]